VVPILGITCGLTESHWYLIISLWLNAATNNGFSRVTLGELFPDITNGIVSILQIMKVDGFIA
jgi:hypothetical protein